MNWLPALSPDKDRSLEEALRRLEGSAIPRPAEGEPLVTAVERIPPVPAQYAPFPEGVDERLLDALRARGIEHVYTHQAEAWRQIAAGQHVVIVTPTASG